MLLFCLFCDYSCACKYTLTHAGRRTFTRIYAHTDRDTQRETRLPLSRRFTPTETTRLIRDGRMKVGEREIIYLSLHCHHQTDSCVKMSSGERHLNVSFTVRDKVTRRCPQTTTFLKRKESRGRFEPRSFCLPCSLTPCR